MHRKTSKQNKPKKPYTLPKAIFLLGVYQEISAKKNIFNARVNITTGKIPRAACLQNNTAD